MNNNILQFQNSAFHYTDHTNIFDDISSCNEVPSHSHGHDPHTNIYFWNRKEIEQTIKELPNAENILKNLIIVDENIVSDSEKNAGDSALMLSLIFKYQNKFKLLVENKFADVNTRDSKGRSVLHLASYLGDVHAVDLLLRNGADVNCWNTDEDVTPLHCAAFSGNVECVRKLIEHNAQINFPKSLKHSALYYAVQKNAIECVQVLLEHKANPATFQIYSKTPLHIAANGGFYECMQLLLQHGAKSSIDAVCQYGHKKYTSLHFCALGNYIECAELLLKNGAKVDPLTENEETPLHLACMEQSAETAALLIKHGANVRRTYNCGRTTLHAAITKQSRFWDCVQLLLDAKVNVNQADDFGYTPLHTAALNDLGSCVLLLLKHGADITARTKGNVTALAIIARRTPDVISKYIENFDSCISINGDGEIGDRDFELRLDFRILMPNVQRGQMELIIAFIDAGQKRILKHPLCSAFLYLKWIRIRKIFILSLLYHLVFGLLISLYVLSLFCTFNNNQNSNFDTWLAENIQVIAILVTFMNSLLCIKEIFQMTHGLRGYLLYWENWLQWVTILGVYLTASFTFMNHNQVRMKEPDYQYHIGAIVIFLVWLELMMIVGRFPIFGLYVQMFTKVSADFVKFLGAYCCLIIAFVLSFRVLFTYHKTFSTLIRSTFKAIFMMAGEFNFEDIFYNNSTLTDYNQNTDIIGYPGTSQIMFVAFVFLVTIVLTNLLVGLAVSDIQALQTSAALERLIRQAELVARVESVLYSKVFIYVFPKLYLFFRKWSNYSKTHLIVKPNKPKYNLLSPSIVASIYKFACARKDEFDNRKSRYTMVQLKPKDKNVDNSRGRTLPSVDLNARGNINDRLDEILHRIEESRQEHARTLNDIMKLIHPDEIDIE